LEYCRLHNITVQAWAPVAKGALSKPDHEIQESRLLETKKLGIAISAKYSVTLEAILAAWVLRHPANMQAVLGTTKPDRIRNR